jgi:hypothetical protein
MNREFKASSPAIRTVIAAAAVLATLATAGSIEGLVRHYDAESSQLARTQPAIVAQR